MSKIKKVYIYSESLSKALDLIEITKFLEDYQLPVENRGGLYGFLDLGEEKAKEDSQRIAGARVLDISKPLEEPRKPFYEEVDFEFRRLREKEEADSVVETLYDGLWLQRIFHKLIARRIASEFKSGFVHLIFTNRLFGTFSEKRYHARVILGGLPSLISTTGVVEAPARPREYYWLKRDYIRIGGDLEELNSMFKDKFIEYDDPRLTGVLKGYTLQAVFYELTGEPFCTNPTCPLFNSHWQAEVLKAQLGGNLCREHKELLKTWTG